jgi:hypothetical protein
MASNPSAFTALQAVPWLPTDQNWLGWTYDPAGALNGSIPSLGVPTLIKVPLRSAGTVTSVTAVVSTGGGTLTAGQNFLGLYSTGGTLIGASADQTANWGAAFAVPQALAGGPYPLAAGYYWVALLCNGTTAPTFLRGISQASSFVNGALGVSAARYATNGTAQTSLPATITPSSNALLGVTYWAGLS